MTPDPLVLPPIRGDDGADYMYGGDGDDTIDAREDLLGGWADTLDGGFGHDCGWWTDGEDTDLNMEGKF